MSSKLRVGLIGYGLSGRFFHAPFLREHHGFELAAVSTSQDVPGVRVFADARAMIASPDLDLIFNCGPNDVHFSLSAEALKAGKHVVVEKPFANTSQEARELIALAGSHDRVLSVFQNRRWDGDFLTLRRLVASGALGDVMHFESRFDRFRPEPNLTRWREKSGSGTGTWWDLGAHLVDQMLVLFGEPDSVTADIFPQRVGALTDDYFHVTFAQGPRRFVLRSSMFAEATPRFEVFGTSGSFVRTGLDTQEASLRSGVSPSAPSFGVDSSDGWLSRAGVRERERVPAERGAYRRFYDELYDCIVGGGDGSANPVAPVGALRVIELLELAKQSSVERRTVVV